MVSCIAIDQPIAGLASASSSNTGFAALTRALQNDWIVDTGCTNHAIGNLAHFVDLKQGDYGTCGGVGGAVKFEGIGMVYILIHGADGKPTVLWLSDIKYCPSIGAFNLISVL